MERLFHSQGKCKASPWDDLAVFCSGIGRCTRGTTALTWTADDDIVLGSRGHEGASKRHYQCEQRVRVAVGDVVAISSVFNSRLCPKGTT